MGVLSMRSPAPRIGHSAGLPPMPEEEEEEKVGSGIRWENRTMAMEASAIATGCGQCGSTLQAVQAVSCTRRTYTASWSLYNKLSSYFFLNCDFETRVRAIRRVRQGWAVSLFPRKSDFCSARHWQPCQNNRRHEVYPGEMPKQSTETVLAAATIVKARTTRLFETAMKSSHDPFAALVSCWKDYNAKDSSHQSASHL